MSSKSYPRSVADYRLVGDWVLRGIPDEVILTRIQREWRSEVIKLPGEPLRCALCLQPITPNSCVECGQTTYEENSNDYQPK